MPSNFRAILPGVNTHRGTRGEPIDNGVHKFNAAWHSLPENEICDPTRRRDKMLHLSSDFNGFKSIPGCVSQFSRAAHLYLSFALWRPTVAATGFRVERLLHLRWSCLSPRTRKDNEPTLQGSQRWFLSVPTGLRCRPRRLRRRKLRSSCRSSWRCFRPLNCAAILVSREGMQLPHR